MKAVSYTAWCRGTRIRANWTSEHAAKRRAPGCHSIRTPLIIFFFSVKNDGDGAHEHNGVLDLFLPGQTEAY